MDILRKELDSFYAGQHLEKETLDRSLLDLRLDIASGFAKADDCCVVVTDIAADRCHIYAGRFGRWLGLTDGTFCCKTAGSSDEDEIYSRIHPEDLVEKRMLEYDFFRLADPLPATRKTEVKATCTLRIRNRGGDYRYVDNSTRVMQLSPGGRIWLVMCTYAFSSRTSAPDGICPAIVDLATGEVSGIRLNGRRTHVLTAREKEILTLIKEGHLSKQIAAILGISINTVNRHRQNILEKLSVGNSVEAVTAAIAMKLL